MTTVGFVGWRGMVGSVLMQRMREERDFDLIEPSVLHDLATWAARARRSARPTGRAEGRERHRGARRSCDVIITCQGGDYTNEIYPKLRAAGWNGYWIDAASALRMDEDAVIILDPVNLPVIDEALAAGVQATTSAATAPSA